LNHPHQNLGDEFQENTLQVNEEKSEFDEKTDGIRSSIPSVTTQTHPESSSSFLKLLKSTEINLNDDEEDADKETFGFGIPNSFGTAIGNFIRASPPVGLLYC
jgi:uncharacterized phage infection (PIP) family protein YhgE